MSKTVSVYTKCLSSRGRQGVHDVTIANEPFMPDKQAMFHQPEDAVIEGIARGRAEVQFQQRKQLVVCDEP